MQIITRTNLDRNVHVLHMAGADLVLSLASMVSSQIINLLEPGRVFMLNEGLNIFRAVAGEGLAGHNLVNSGIRKNLRCNVVAVRTARGDMLVNPDPLRVFQATDELFLIGDAASETAYYEEYWPDRGRRECDPTCGDENRPRTRTGLVCLIAGMPKTRRQKLVSGGVLGEASGVFWKFFRRGASRASSAGHLAVFFPFFCRTGQSRKNFFEKMWKRARKTLFPGPFSCGTCGFNCA